LSKQLNEPSADVELVNSLKKLLEFLDSSENEFELDNELEAHIKRLIKNSASRFSTAALGLYSYPVLMAADILGYKATHVPVGEDQKQHLELARDIAGAFNRAYGQEYFPLPEPLILGEATRVMSLRDGRAKMSKSDASDMSRINLTDDADMIANKIRKAKSDMVEGITYDPENRPGVANLLNIFAALSDVSRKEIEARYASSNFAQFKKDLTDLAVDKLAPLTAKMRVLLDDPANIDGFLQVGTEKANDIASKHLAEVKDIVGFFHSQQSAFR
jgi:tryptophanyl-tRNA synthetase